MAPNSGSKRYTEITREEFEQFLKNREELWGPVDPARVHEKVYRTARFAPDDDRFSLWCYSTIDKHTQKSRSKGSDAIRLVVVVDDHLHLKYGEKKTLRIQTWKKNLSKKIDRLLELGKNGVKICPECGDVMLTREGKYGEFWGCNSYPECQNTLQIEDESDTQPPL